MDVYNQKIDGVGESHQVDWCSSTCRATKRGILPKTFFRDTSRCIVIPKSDTSSPCGKRVSSDEEDSGDEVWRKWSSTHIVLFPSGKVVYRKYNESDDSEDLELL